MSNETAVQKRDKSKLNPVENMLLTVVDTISRREGRLEQLLPSDMSPQRFTEAVRLALATNNDLLQCTPESVVGAVLKAAKLGIDVSGGALGHGYLTKYGTECTFVPGYKGLVALAVLAGVVQDMTPIAVHEADHFVPEEGDNPRIEHRPFVPRKSTDKRGAIIATYTRVLLPSGAKVVKGLLYLDDIERIEAGVKASKSPWKGPHRTEQIKKSSIKNAFKTLGVPSSEQAARLRAALEADNDADALEVEGRVISSEPAPTSRTQGLKNRLTEGQPRETLESPRERLAISHPEAEPPDDVALPSGREPGSDG